MVKALRVCVLRFGIAWRMNGAFNLLIVNLFVSAVVTKKGIDETYKD